jgi:hypothetical protein
MMQRSQQHHDAEQDDSDTLEYAQRAGLEHEHVFGI